LFKIAKPTKILLLILFAIAILSFAFAYLYYSSKNKAEDPRVVETKFMLQRFDLLMSELNYTSALLLLDTIQAVFTNIACYRESYETGMVFNNRGSAFLSMALYEVEDSIEQQKLLGFAGENLDSSIRIYKNWLSQYEYLPADSITKILTPCFRKDDKAFSDSDSKVILKKRVEDIVLAQKETKRRLSVSYTNLGIVKRHQYLQNEAIECYKQAIDLWGDNFTARSNLNVLMGNPPKKRSVVDQLFPPDKNKYE
jgi:tetratricopeptide (TPR) repeat protein